MGLFEKKFNGFEKQEKNSSYESVEIIEKQHDEVRVIKPKEQIQPQVSSQPVHQQQVGSPVSMVDETRRSSHSHSSAPSSMVASSNSSASVSQGSSYATTSSSNYSSSSSSTKSGGYSGGQCCNMARSGGVRRCATCPHR